MLIICQVRNDENGESCSPQSFPLTHHMCLESYTECPEMFQYLALVEGDALTWVVYDGQEVGDKFVIENEVLSLDEVRERNITPRYSK